MLYGRECELTRSHYRRSSRRMPLQGGGIHSTLTPHSSGMAVDTKFLLEISGNGKLNWHPDRGFHALGSGSHFATVVMETMKPHLDDGPPDLRLGQIVAYRTIDTTCAVSADLSGPVQMAVADSSGSRVLGEDELQAKEESVQSWRVSEHSLLRSLSDGSGS